MNDKLAVDLDLATCNKGKANSNHPNMKINIV